MQEQTIGNDVNFGHLLENELDTIDEDCLPQLVSFIQANEYSLSVVESFTSGMLAQTIAQYPAVASFFLGGIIAMHPRVQVGLIGVQPKTISKYGTISSEVAFEMATGIKKLTNSTIAIAINGNLDGPVENGSTELEKVVFISWNINDNIKKTKRYHLKGDRNKIIDTTVFIALSMCLRYLKMNKKG